MHRRHSPCPRAPKLEFSASPKRVSSVAAERRARSPLALPAYPTACRLSPHTVLPPCLPHHTKRRRGIRPFAPPPGPPLADQPGFAPVQGAPAFCASSATPAWGAGRIQSRMLRLHPTLRTCPPTRTLIGAAGLLRQGRPVPPPPSSSEQPDDRRAAERTRSACEDARGVPDSRRNGLSGRPVGCRLSGRCSEPFLRPTSPSPG